MVKVRTKYEFGYHVLGPIFYSFSYKLWLNQQVWTDRDSLTLFLSRGGLRLRYVYNLFLSKNNIKAPLPEEDFYVSRMALLKASYLKTPEETSTLLQREYNCVTVLKAMEYLLPKAVFHSWQSSLCTVEKEIYKKRDIQVDDFCEFIKPTHAGYTVLAAYLKSHTKELRRHLDEIRQGNSHLLMVDTGWSGTILRECQSIFPDINFFGHFFGRSAFSSQVPEHFSNLQGVAFEADRYHWLYPLSSILLHRHLIEGVFEPKWPSVEGYLLESPHDLIQPETGVIPDNIRKPSIEDDFLNGICDYIAKSDTELNANQIQREENLAAKMIQRLIVFPSRSQLDFLTVDTRSADFGKGLDVSVLIYDGYGQSISQKLNRVTQSLWPHGQVAIEFSGLMRVSIQFLLSCPNLMNKLWAFTNKYILRRAS
ncbi:hypothetical protein Ssed_3007 [Shewanella sediminis HAW-EB3]|uniref:Uncharacterized protein n=1 Tax=Shewanella sediminis (strain HAW-EB3) TaxID=425104 RepID=A8FXN8_SHESH|nr:hypothetical protein [Shewanella sediminis]ABV37611.1 hypothetical protein Ssed_3007 [Shewanella sediminis HAW-EB3]